MYSHREENDRKRAREVERKEARIPLMKAKRSYDILHNARILVDPNVTIDNGALKELNASVVDDHCIANVFVVPTMVEAQQSSRICWACRLNGGTLCLPLFVSSGGKDSAISYERATSTRRHIYCTDAFQVAHPVIYGIIKVVTAQSGSNWKLRNYDDFEKSKKAEKLFR